MKTNPEHAAFSRPISELPGASRYTPASDGLTKLEYFTAAALTGILAADTDGNMSEEKAARYAVKQARAVIAELNAEGGK